MQLKAHCKLTTPNFNVFFCALMSLSKLRLGNCESKLASLILYISSEDSSWVLSLDPYSIMAAVLSSIAFTFWKSHWEHLFSFFFFALHFFLPNFPVQWGQPSDAPRLTIHTYHSMFHLCARFSASWPGQFLLSLLKHVVVDEKIIEIFNEGFRFLREGEEMFA